MSNILRFLERAVLLIPISYTIGRKYGLTNEAFIGACFIPNGIGSMIGAPLAGRISDRTITRLKVQRGRWYPEDRLRAALLPALTLVPVSAIIDMVFSPCSAYIVDIVHSRSAESVAANRCLWAVIKYGETMRGWIDVGYSTEEDN
ncbi:hypothetical protein EST38_g14342 [Candolleomyces aberdarensis]|uniref:Uncharacterized protein n=1 Tax=Candolleomyces aberdarensis TaxID=2316362 RepID=A0A4Q2CZW9_9AGAR|nr:hypothetical protein EST38_g14342 [Candolleomyces aberdarensis]